MLMGSIERKLKMVTYLCRKRYASMTELAQHFDVSIRTIQRDVLELEVLGIPLDVKTGRYKGGVYIVGNYTIDRMYMEKEEIVLLKKIKQAIEQKRIIQLDDNEYQVLNQLIRTYTKHSL